MKGLNERTNANQQKPFDAAKAYELLELFERAKQEHLLGQQYFMPSRRGFSFGNWPSKCEAGALTTELTAQFRAYFNTKNRACKTRAPASVVSALAPVPRKDPRPDELDYLLKTYALYCRAEGHSEKSIEIVSLSLKLCPLPCRKQPGINLAEAGPADIRLFSTIFP